MGEARKRALFEIRKERLNIVEQLTKVLLGNDSVCKEEKVKKDLKEGGTLTKQRRELLAAQRGKKTPIGASGREATYVDCTPRKHLPRLPLNWAIPYFFPSKSAATAPSASEGPTSGLLRRPMKLMDFFEEPQRFGSPSLLPRPASSVLLTVLSLKNRQRGLLYPIGS